MSKGVYISCHDKTLANEAAVKLIEAGHVVVSTWHEGGERPPDGDSVEWGFKARDNFEQIMDAEVFVLIASPEHLSREECVPGGKFVEAGFASGRRSLRLIERVFTVGGVENGMLWHPNFEHVATVEELIRVLEGAK